MYWVCDTTKQFYKQYYQLCFSNTHIRDRYSLSDSVWYLTRRQWSRFSADKHSFTIMYANEFQLISNEILYQ